ncbi:peroxide stress protein YaaA [Streptococcus catagoni]|uniref:peroxide stress protein YaaA n=1 Tax=Streptococcus catagoni TaxID=2654874 RepID=UPI00140A994F|nr:peroxide stress protein YaaA [Streptococcus catagoni]
MLTFLIPTAKEMKIPEKSFSPQIPEKSKTILEAMLSLSMDQLAKAYKLSPIASQKEKERLEAIYASTSPTYPAYQLFNGLMYRYIKREDLEQKYYDYLRKHVFITSALYGIIPIDFPIAEHRLDFQTKIKIKELSLKNFWRPDYDTFLKNKNTIISLLSSEFEGVFSKEKEQLWISITFMEEKNGILKTHSTISKKARGAFLTACMEKQIEEVDQLKKLAFNDFAYCPEKSTDNKFIYIKKEA